MDDKESEDKVQSFASIIKEGKRAKINEDKKKLEERKKKLVEKFNLSSISLDSFEFISELSRVKSNKPTIEPEVNEPVIVEEIVEETIPEEIETTVEPEQILEVVGVKPTDDIVEQTAKTITKVVENTNLFSTPEVAPAPNTKAIQDKLKFLEQWVGKISAAGPGSGSYWLSDMGDTDKTSLRGATDGQVLSYSEVNRKWVAVDPTSTGGGTLDQWARNQANASGIIAQSAFDYANTVVSDTQIDPYSRVTANAAFDYANTINAATLTGNTLNTTIVSSNLTSVGTLDGLYISSSTGGEFFTISGASRPSSGTQTWKFWTNTNIGGPDSYLQFPDSTIQKTAFTGAGTDQTARDEANSANTLAQSGYNYSNTIITTVNAFIGSNVSNVNSSITANAASANSVINTRISSNVATLRGEITSNISTANTFTQAAYNTANNAYSTAMNVYSTVGVVAIDTQNAYDQANSAYVKANTALTTSGGTANGSITANYSTAFIAGDAAISGVALQMPNEGALRNLTNGFNNMYFDVSNGGSAHGAFQFRSSNGFTNVLTMSPTSVSFNTDATVTSRTPNIGKLPWNSAIDSELTVDGYRFRVSNQGGIFPQIIGNGSSRNLAWTGVGAVSGSAITQVGSTGTIVSSSDWTTLYNAHGMDSPGDTITVTLQDKSAGRIYRITYMRGDNGSTTGYNIIVERLL